MDRHEPEVLDERLERERRRRGQVLVALDRGLDLIVAGVGERARRVRHAGGDLLTAVLEVPVPAAPVVVKSFNTTAPAGLTRK